MTQKIASLASYYLQKYGESAPDIARLRAQEQAEAAGRDAWIAVAETARGLLAARPRGRYVSDPFYCDGLDPPIE